MASGRFGTALSNVAAFATGAKAMFHASFHPGGAGARTRKEQHEAACVRAIVYKVFVSGKEAVRAVVRVARMQVWPGPQSAFGHWWRGAVRDPVWETEILAAVPPRVACGR